MPETLNQLTVAEARSKLDADEISSAELTRSCLDQIRSLNGALNAVVQVFEEDAIHEADQSDRRRVKGERNGVFDGVPILLKDNLMIQGRRVTACSKILATHVASYDATVVRRLKEQGAVILGRTNMDEFAMGASTEHSAYGPTRHPRDPERVPGGSSGGNATAVASNMCIAALGSDTGGSIRQPAAFCGIVGLKPTYGRVSRSGLIAMASSLDQIGPMTKTVEDAALVLQAIQGQDPSDQTTSDNPPFVPEWKEKLSGLRIGLPRQAWGEGIEKGVREAVMSAARALENLGASVQEVDLPYADEALAVYYMVMPCEVSANLARFDGMRYGARLEGLPLYETYARSRAQGFGPEVRRRILLGTYALSRGYYEAYYLHAKRVQTLIRRAYEQALREVDILLTPTTPTTAFKIGEKISDPLTMYMGDIFTVGANVAGLPAISIPCGLSDGLPVGLHMIGRPFDEAALLAVARAYEIVS